MVNLVFSKSSQVWYKFGDLKFGFRNSEFRCGLTSMLKHGPRMISFVMICNQNPT